MENTILTKSSRKVNLAEIKQALQEVIVKFQPEKIILFGSYAEGNVTPDSDVDLLIIVAGNKPSWEMAIDISLMIKHTFPMDILVRTPQELKERIRKGDFFLKEVLEKGKILYERTGSGMD